MSVLTLSVPLSFKFVFLGAFLLIPIVFSLVYFYLDSVNECVRISDEILSYQDFLYFSVITLTGLGYADVYPVAVCRYIAGLEAYIGFTFLPVIVAMSLSNLPSIPKLRG